MAILTSMASTEREMPSPTPWARSTTGRPQGGWSRGWTTDTAQALYLLQQLLIPCLMYMLATPSTTLARQYMNNILCNK